MKKELLIVPDVHGRQFWKDVLLYKDVPIVFLGDYVAPYTQYEGITNEQSIEMFKEILEFRKQNPDRVTLLLGNHDMTYSVGIAMCNNRVDNRNYDIIRKLFWDKTNEFQLTKGVTINGKNFLLSHAGYTKGWIKDSKELFMTENLDQIFKDWDYLNRMNNKHSDLLYRNLKATSALRGGYDMNGSPIWADVNEHAIPQKMAPKETDWIQVFGHSWCRQALHGICHYEWYMLDCNKVFYIDEEGNVRYLDTDEMIPTTDFS